MNKTNKTSAEVEKIAEKCAERLFDYARQVADGGIRYMARMTVEGIIKTHITESTAHLQQRVKELEALMEAYNPSDPTMKQQRDEALARNAELRESLEFFQKTMEDIPFASPGLRELERHIVPRLLSTNPESAFMQRLADLEKEATILQQNEHLALQQLAKLKEDLRKTRKHLEDANRGAETNAHCARIAVEKRLAVEQQLASTKADSERLDWLDKETKTRCIQLSTQLENKVLLHLNGIGFVVNDKIKRVVFDDVRQAIDAAIQSSKKK